jgi:hypothetical protein
MSDARNDLADAQSRLDGLANLGAAERVAALEAIAASLESALAREPD